MTNSEKGIEGVVLGTAFIFIDLLSVGRDGKMTLSISAGGKASHCESSKYGGRFVFGLAGCGSLLILTVALKSLMK